MSDFDDIDIVDLDIAKTTASRVHASMRTLHLRLSREPDVAWTRHFFDERGRRASARRHGLWIEDGFIVVDCFLDDVETHHLPDIRRSIAYANERSRAGAERRRDESLQQRSDGIAEQDALAALRSRIRAGSAPAESAADPPPREDVAAGEGAAAREDVAAREASPLGRKRSDWQAGFRAALAARRKGRDRD